MKVKLLSLAEKDLLDIYNYYDTKEGNLVFAITIYNDLLDEAFKLGELKNIINTNPIYTSSKGNLYYSHVVSSRNNYKLIYTEKNDIIYISVIWDCRRNPKILTRIIESRG